MKNKIAIVFICILMLITGLSARVQAKTGKVVFTVNEEVTNSVEGGLTIDLYKIADLTWVGRRVDGVIVNYSFQLTEPFQDLDTPDFNRLTYESDHELLDDFANRAAAIVAQGGLTAINVDPAVETEVDTGLYLAIPHGANETAVEDYLKQIDGIYRSFTFSDSREYDFKPNLVFVTEIRDVEIALKYEVFPRYGKLIINKDLLNHAGKPVTFVFHVEAYDAWGNPVYDDYYSLTFNEAGSDYLEITDIPVGSTVIVTEVYSGAGYNVVGDDSFTLTIEKPAEESENTPAEVTFKNEFDDHNIHGYGVCNEFVKTQHGWEFMGNDLGGQ